MCRHNYLDYHFEELPLVIENGKSAGLIAGSAEIKYFADGTWSIVSIFADGHSPVGVTEEQKFLARITGKPAPKDWEHVSVRLDEGTLLHDTIYDRLENECRDGVQTAVREAIETERDQREAAYADFRNAARMERALT